MTKLGRTLARLKGRAMKPVANAAGDRRSEAKALFEAQTGEKPKDPQLDAVEHDIRRLHGDMDDRA